MVLHRVEQSGSISIMPLKKNNILSGGWQTVTYLTVQHPRRTQIQVFTYVRMFVSNVACDEGSLITTNPFLVQPICASPLRKQKTYSRWTMILNLLIPMQEDSVGVTADPFPPAGHPILWVHLFNGIFYHCNIDHLASVWFLSLFFMVTSHFAWTVKAEQVLYVKVNIWTTKTINTSHVDQNIALSKMP